MLLVLGCLVAISLATQLAAFALNQCPIQWLTLLIHQTVFTSWQSRFLSPDKTYEEYKKLNWGALNKLHFSRRNFCALLRSLETVPHSKIEFHWKTRSDKLYHKACMSKSMSTHDYSRLEAATSRWRIVFFWYAFFFTKKLKQYSDWKLPSVPFPTVTVPLCAFSTVTLGPIKG